MPSPWRVRRRHRSGLLFAMLRLATARSDGQRLDTRDAARLAAFQRQLLADGLVIHYEPRTLQGWWLVPRREGVDRNMIREPGEMARRRRARV